MLAVRTYLEISMDHSILVTMIDALKNLLDAVRGVGLGIKLPGDNVLEEFSASDEVEDEVVEVLLLNAIVQTDNVRVLQFAANSGLAFQLLKISGGQFLGVDDLGGELEAGVFLNAPPDNRKRAPAKDREVRNEA